MKFTILAGMIIASFGFSILIPAQAHAQFPSARDSCSTQSDRLCDGEIENFEEVIPGVLYRGAQPPDVAFRKLRVQYHITTVVNLRRFHSDENVIAKISGLKYIRIKNWATHVEDEDVGRFLQVMSDPTNYPVFVHCRLGADRTGLMVAAYRLLIQNPPAAQAEVEAELSRHKFHHYKSIINWLHGVEAVTPVDRPKKLKTLIAIANRRLQHNL